MEIEIKNFGPIDYLKFDLKKDFHLIYGQNSIGKSYATYCLYCLLKNLRNKFSLFSFKIYDLNFEKQYEKLISAKVKKVEVNSTINFTRDYNKIIQNELKALVLEVIHNSFKNSFSSLKNLRNRYSDKDFELIIAISENEKIIIFLNNEGTLDLKYFGEFNKIEIVHKELKSSSKFLLLYNGIEAGSNTNEKKFSQLISLKLTINIFQFLTNLDDKIVDIHYLPASRSGLYEALNSFTPIIAELTQNRFFMQNKSIELPSLSDPVSDYFLDLSTVDKKHINKEFEPIIDLIQTNIIKGNVEYNDITKKIIYKPDGTDLELNLSEASSMVAELSPLVLYLRHILNNKHLSSNRAEYLSFQNELIPKKSKKERGYDILFIEEPEAHLHPEVQVELIEIFAKLSALKLKIFITTHSNYMFNKLNNLIIKNEIDQNKLCVYHLVKFKNGTTVNNEMEVSEFGISDDNFQEVSEKLYNERFNYLEGEYAG